MIQYRTPKGKFVARSNPIAVAARINASRAAQRATITARRRNDARRRGYTGPLTRADLARER